MGAQLNITAHMELPNVSTLSISHPYPSDLSDQEWEILTPLIPPAKPAGRRRKWPMLKVINATFYLLRYKMRGIVGEEGGRPYSDAHSTLQR
jgi:putative transposase